MIRSAITRASFRACLDDGPVLAALVSVRLLLSCSCIRGDVTRDTNLTLSFAALFSHSACVLYSRRSGNPNPKRPGAAPRKANRRRRRLDSRPAGPHSRDERSEGCIGVSDPQNPRRRSWLEPNCEHGSEHYIHHPASTVAHRSARRHAPAGGRRCYHTTRQLRARSPVCTSSQWLAPALVPHSLSHLPSTWTMAFIVSPGSAHQ